jgi:hypothetical protein
VCIAKLDIAINQIRRFRARQSLTGEAVNFLKANLAVVMIPLLAPGRVRLPNRIFRVNGILFVFCSACRMTAEDRAPKMGGWPTHSRFFVHERSRLDDTTPVRQRRVTGLAFQGARSFRFLEGSGF